MPAPIDTGLLKGFSVIWSFLLVFIFMFVVLTRINSFKERPMWAGFVSLILAIMLSFSRIAMKTITLMAPWFVLLFVFIVFILITYQAFGIEEKTITNIISGKTPGQYGSTFFFWMLAIVLLITIGSLSTVISEEKGFKSLTLGANVTHAEAQAPTEKTDFWSTIFHPKVLGMILLMLIALFTIQRLTDSG